MRNFIFDNFILKQVISLPFNAFFPAQANVKTSMLHLRRRKQDEQQGDVFMAITNNIGHDDHCRNTPHRNNMDHVAAFHDQWVNEGRLVAQTTHNEDPDEPLGCPLQVFVCPASKLSRHRIDAFYYAPELHRTKVKLRALAKAGHIRLLSEKEIQLIPPMTGREEDACIGRSFKYFEISDVTRDGTIVQFREGLFKDLPTRGRLMVATNDVLFAKNNSSRGTTVVVPPEFDGQLATTGFIGIRPSSSEDALLLWYAPRIRVISATGLLLGNHRKSTRSKEDIFLKEMLVPIPAGSNIRRKMLARASRVWESRRAFRDSLDISMRLLSDVGLD